MEASDLAVGKAAGRGRVELLRDDSFVGPPPPLLDRNAFSFIKAVGGLGSVSQLYSDVRCENSCHIRPTTEPLSQKDTQYTLVY